MPVASSMADRGSAEGRLADNIVYFARALRKAGMRVGPASVVDAIDAVRELEIVNRKVPQANKRLSAEVVGFIQKLRQLDLFKAPGVAETLDWAGALTELDKVALDPETVSDTIGVLLKYQDDIARIEQGEGRRLLKEVKAELSTAAE